MANLLSWLGNQLHGVEAQINPWDNGATYNSVVNHQPAPQAPQPAPQQVAPQMLNPQAQQQWLARNSPQSVAPQAPQIYRSTPSPIQSIQTTPPPIQAPRPTFAPQMLTPQAQQAWSAKNNPQLPQQPIQTVPKVNIPSQQTQQSTQAVQQPTPQLQPVDTASQSPLRTNEFNVYNDLVGQYNQLNNSSDQAKFMNDINNIASKGNGNYQLAAKDIQSKLNPSLLDKVGQAIVNNSGFNSIKDLGTGLGTALAYDTNPTVQNAVSSDPQFAAQLQANTDPRTIVPAALGTAMTLVTPGLGKQAAGTLTGLLTRDTLMPTLQKMGIGSVAGGLAMPAITAGTEALGSGLATGKVSVNPQDVINSIAPGVIGGGLLAGKGKPGKLLITNAVNTVKDMNVVKAIEQVNPKIAQIDETLGNYKKAFDVETNPVRREQINQGIAQLNAERRNTLQGGFIAGPLAGDFSKAQATGKVFDGVDGKPRFEVSDQGAKIKDPNGSTLGQVLGHPQLYKQYPGLKDVRVALNDGQGSSFGRNTISLSKGTTKDPSTLLHEVQHAIQDKENFAAGGDTPNLSNPATIEKYKTYLNTDNGKSQLLKNKSDALAKDITLTNQQATNLAGHKTKNDWAYSQYHNLAGEAEARAVQARMGMSDGERYVAPKTADSYGMSHRPDSEGPRAFNMTEGDMLPSDYYQNPQYYGANMKNLSDKQSFAVLQKIKDNPEAEITVYRAGTNNEFNSGDWVSLSKDYAQQHATSNGNSKFKVFEQKVKAKDVRFAGDDINEFGYYPEQKPKSTFYDSLDVPKKDLIIRSGEGKAMSIDPTPSKPLPTTPKTEVPQIPKLNEAPKTPVVTKGITTKQQSMGDALGMSPKEVKSAIASKSSLESPKNTQPKPPVPPKLRSGTGTNLSRQGASVLKAQEKVSAPLQKSQQGLKQGLPVTQAGEKTQNFSKNQKVSSSYKTKYSTNNKSISITKVNPGDYEKVRSNAQLAKSVVNNHAQGVIHALNNLPKAERTTFWHKVEDPTLPRSEKMQEAINRWRGMSDTVHATSQALGGDTPHIKDYARHNWDLSNPADAERFTKLMNEKFATTNTKNLNPEDFKGLDNRPRVFDSIKQGEAAGFKLKNDDPIKDIISYAKTSENKLKNQAVVRGMSEAEANITPREKAIQKQLGYGQDSIKVTPQGAKALDSLYPPLKSTNKVLKGYRASNHWLKRVLLSLSQFHTINIGMQATPTLALRGHPIRALRGAIDSAVSINKRYSDHIMQRALNDGTLEDAARIGTPIGYSSDFSSGGLDLQSKFGERMVFERQLPAMHVQMVKAVTAELKSRGVSLDSIEARKAGTEVNQVMGYVNTEMRGLNPTVQRGLSDIALAPQFTRAKWEVLRDAFTKGGVAGSYARSAVVGKYMAQATLIAGVGAILGQTSDNWKDILLRALIHPSIPTPFKDAKGNNIELGLPSNYISEVAGLISTLGRGTDGRLNVNMNPSNLPENLANYGRSRLAVLPSAALKVTTNENFANKPLYDPNAPLPSRIAQGATTIIGGNLPIGMQGLLYTKAGKTVLGSIPGVGGDIKNVLDSATPGADPILKSVGSSFGFTPRTDKTVGKGLQTTQYFSALDQAKQGLNAQATNAINLYTGGKKNPVTGQYEVPPTADDSRAKATALLQNPTAIDHLITMNQSLAKQRQTVDPLWGQSKANITAYLQYQAMPPGSADKTDWINKNPWYMGADGKSGVASQRDTFFNSLPAGDPNKPPTPIAYPTASAAVQSAMDQYSTLTTGADKSAFIDAHPELLQQWNAQSKYTNDMRVAQGYAPLKGNPQASPKLQAYMDNYSAADKGTRKAIRNSDPTSYQNMIAFYDSVDLSTINKQGALNQLQGEPDQTTKQNKAIKNLAQDIYQNPDGTYQIVPAGWMNGLGGSGYGSKGSGSSKPKDLSAALKANNALKIPKFTAFKPSTGAIKSPTYKTQTMKNYIVAKTPNMKMPKTPRLSIPRVSTIKTPRVTRKRVA